MKLRLIEIVAKKLKFFAGIFFLNFHEQMDASNDPPQRPSTL